MNTLNVSCWTAAHSLRAPRRKCSNKDVDDQLTGRQRTLTMQASPGTPNQEPHDVSPPATADDGPALQRSGRLSFRLVRIRIKPSSPPVCARGAVVTRRGGCTPARRKPPRDILGQSEPAPPLLDLEDRHGLGLLGKCLAKSRRCRVAKRPVQRLPAQERSVQAQQIRLELLCKLLDVTDII